MFLSKEKFAQRMQMLLVALSAASLTVILHSVGVENNFYYVYWWYDLMTHALGGVSIGALVISLLSEKMWSSIYILPIVLLPIIGWEMFEIFFINITTNSIEYIKDTTLDIVVGLLGVCGAILVCKRVKGKDH